MNFAAALMRRGARAAARAERRAAREVAAFAEREFEGIVAEVGEGGVRLFGRRLRRRAETDARLRWLARAWRE